MNTPAHALINLALLGRVTPPGAVAAVLAGGLLPDLPMLVFYAVQRLEGVPEATIWSERYFAPQWQAFFDAPNSLVLIGAAAALCAWRRWPIGLLLCASMALHGVADLALHHDDGHRHFWPVSDFRFESPLSYWDPAHYGRWFMPAELIAALAAFLWAWRRYTDRFNRVLLGALGTIHVAYLVFALAVWGAMA